MHCIIHKFYQAFQAKDYESMAECYHPEVRFNDPVFKDLDYEGVTNMWKMLILRGKDLELDFDQVECTDDTGSARWTATYTFSKTQRKVTNTIHASFEIKAGKIFKHTDTFDFHAWAKQAFGPMGAILSRLGILKGKVRKQAQHSLDRFIRKEQKQ